MKITYIVKSTKPVNVYYTWPGEAPVLSWHVMDFQGISYEVLEDGSLVVHKLDYHARFPQDSLPYLTITVMTTSLPCTGVDFVAEARR